MATTHVAFLRAVNVGGRVVKMEALRKIFSDAGFKDVRTFIQSGNVFFESTATPRTLEPKIEKLLTKALGYPVPVMVRAIDELDAMVESSPFQRMTPAEHERHLVAFLSEPLPKTKFPVVGPKGDFQIIGADQGAAFLVTDVSKAVPNPAPFLEKTFGVQMTGRFWHTTLKLIEAAKKG